jgi:hypothetical protein
MSLWIPYGIQKRIIPLVAGGRDKLHPDLSGFVLLKVYNSTNVFQFTSFLSPGSHYQLVSLI